MKSLIILKFSIYAVCFLALNFTVIFHLTNVNTKLSLEDEQFLSILHGDKNNLDKQQTVKSFESEVAAIKKIYETVVDHGRISPFRAYGKNHKRNIEQFLSGPTLVCHVSTRVLEQSLVYFGYEVRHVFILSATEHGVLSLFKANVPSHAISEVKTSKGWLMLDPNFNMIYSYKGEVFSASTITENTLIKHEIFHNPHIVIPGLYSRHGLFFWPFLRLPDINWRNFLSFDLSFSNYRLSYEDDELKFGIRLI